MRRCLPASFLEELLAIAGSATPVLIDPVSTADARQMERFAAGFLR
jgi:hypothetical protein